MNQRIHAPIIPQKKSVWKCYFADKSSTRFPFSDAIFYDQCMIFFQASVPIDNRLLTYKDYDIAARYAQGRRIGSTLFLVP